MNKDSMEVFARIFSIVFACYIVWNLPWDWWRGKRKAIFFSRERARSPEFSYYFSMIIDCLTVFSLFFIPIFTRGPFSGRVGAVLMGYLVWNFGVLIVQNEEGSNEGCFGVILWIFGAYLIAWGLTSVVYLADLWDIIETILDA